MLHMTRAFLIVAIFFAAALASAQTSGSSTEQIYSSTNERGEKTYLLLYLEDRRWNLEEITQHSDGWQDLISRQSFDSKEQALQALNILQTNHPRVQAVNPLAEASSEIVLQGGSLWPTTATWSWDWEKKYGEWLQQNMNSDFFKKYQVATDCADVAYSARWIFARIYGLPVANRISGSNAILTNQSLRPEWKNLPTAKNWYEDKRFRAALNYLLNMTYTHTLMRDSYPIAINPDHFLAGVHFLNLHDRTGHTQLVHRVNVGEDALIPFLIVQSTVPRKVREVNESLFWGREPVKKDTSGFLRILWPKIRNGVYSIEKAENMPGYSLEQYSPDFIREKDRAYSLEVMLRLKPDLDFVAVLKGGFHNLKEMLKIRQGLVEEGFKNCPARSCKPESGLYDDWSTPSRDKQIGELMKQLKMILVMPFSEKLSKEIRAAYKQEMESVALQLEGQNFTMGSIIFAWDNHTFSSDPNDEPGLRWSLAPEFMAKSLQVSLEKGWEERKNKITFEGDNNLRSKFLASRRYCRVFSADQCAQFKTEIEKPLELSGQKRSLQEWLELTMWLNSDSRQSRENQWGGLRSKSKYYALEKDLKKFLVSDLGVAYTEDSQGTKKIGFIDNKGLQETALPEGFVWETFDQENSVAWAKTSSELLRHDFKNQTQQVIAIPVTEDFRVLNFQGDFLKVATSKEILSLQMDVKKSAAAVLWQGPAEQARFIKDHVYAGLQNSQWHFYDFSQAQPLVIPVTLDLSSSLVFNQNARFIGFTANGKFWVLEKATGALRDVSHVGPSLKWSEGFSKVIVMDLAQGGIYLRSLDDQFQVVKEQKISDFGMMSGDHLLTYNTTGMNIYKFKGEALQELPLQSDEEKHADFSGDLVLTFLKGKETKFRLRRLDGSKTFYTGTQRVFLRGAQNTDGPEVLMRGSFENMADLKINSVKAIEGPALMNGDFINFFATAGVDSNFVEPQTSIQKGAVFYYQDFGFWVEFP